MERWVEMQLTSATVTQSDAIHTAANALLNQ